MPNTTDHWVHDLSPFLIQFNESFGVRYYGLSYALAFVIAFWLLGLFRRHGRSPLRSAEEETALMTWLIVGTLLGGRLGFMLLYDLGDFLRAPWTFFQVWQGGMASHGGFVGVVLAGLFFARRHSIPFPRLADLLVPLTPPGLMLGRIANFINGELWGKVSDAPWAVIFPHSAPPGTPVHLIAPRHPSQLYEAALEGVVLIVYTQLRYWLGSDLRRHPGRLAGEFLIVYALLRILGEQFRQPDADLILGVSRGIFYSSLMILVGLVVLWRTRKPVDPEQYDRRSPPRQQRRREERKG